MYSDHYEIGNVEIGAEQAIRRIVEKARDNRSPAPKMKAVEVDAPEDPVEDEIMDWFANIAIGCGVAIGVANPFPMTAKFLQRFGAGRDKPRYVRVDTEESYEAFRAECSPEMAEMQERIRQLEDDLRAHAADPEAHAGLLRAVEETEAVGAEVAEAEAEKEIDLMLPEGVEGLIWAWREGDFVGASARLPGPDGEVRICTAMMPADCCIEEMEHHALDADVSATDVIGGIDLTGMGCVLGAGTLVKEMMAAAPSILDRPEAKVCAPFTCRIEPKASPALCAFIALAQACAAGDSQACAEWNALADAARKGGAKPAAQAMVEAQKLFSKACKVA